jgi:hypothetical protein
MALRSLDNLFYPIWAEKGANSISGKKPEADKSDFMLKNIFTNINRLI